MREPIPGPDWIPVFLETLVKTRMVSRATEATRRTPGTIYAQQKRNQAFAEAWTAALAGQLTAEEARKAQAGLVDSPANGGWKTIFLEALAENSHIKQAAKLANVPVSTVYAERRKSPDFARRWQSALFEGYTNLEMEVLGHLRGNDAESRMDIANSLRRLAAHRDGFSREQAQRRNVTAAEVRASIERKVQRLRNQIAERKARETDGQE